MIPVGAPVRVRDLLVRAADGPVRIVHRGRDAVYVALTDPGSSGPGGRAPREACVGVLGRRAVAVPCGLRSQRDTLDVATAALHDGILHLDGVPVVVRRLVDVRVPALASVGPAGLAAPGRQAASPELPARVTPATVADLVGRGDGLTPLGDDVLCGWLALHRAAATPTPDVDAAVRARLHRTTLLSAELLHCALDGDVVPQFAALVAALGTPAEAGAAAALATVGHTSGAGMVHGAALALSALCTEGVAA